MSEKRGFTHASEWAKERYRPRGISIASRRRKRTSRASTSGDARGSALATLAVTLAVTFTGFLLILTAVLLLESLGQSPLQGRTAGLLLARATPSDPAHALPTDPSQRGHAELYGDTLTVLFEPTRLDEANSSLTALVDVLLGQQLQSELVDATSGEPIAALQTIMACHLGTCQSESTYRLAPRYAKENVVIHLLPRGIPDAADQGSFSLSLATLFQPIQAETIDTFGTPSDLSAQLISGIPLIWNPDRYLGDAFYGTLEVSIRLPPDVVWPLPGVGGSAVIQPAVLFQLGSLSTPLGTREVHVDTVADPEDLPRPAPLNQTAQIAQLRTTPPMELWFTRPGLDQVYVYTVAGGVPVFLAGLSLLLVSWHASEEDRRRTLHETLIGLSAAAFSILPLRAVLIPQVVPGLTRVDRILGCVVALLLVMATATYCWETRRTSKQVGSEPGDPAQA